MLGVTERVPRFCKKYINLSEIIPKAIAEYVAEVGTRSFPDESRHTYEMPEEEWRRFLEMRQDMSK